MTEYHLAAIFENEKAKISINEAQRKDKIYYHQDPYL